MLWLLLGLCTAETAEQGAQQVAAALLRLLLGLRTAKTAKQAAKQVTAALLRLLLGLRTAKTAEQAAKQVAAALLRLLLGLRTAKTAKQAAHQIFRLFRSRLLCLGLRFALGTAGHAAKQGGEKIASAFFGCGVAAHEGIDQHACRLLIEFLPFELLSSIFETFSVKLC